MKISFPIVSYVSKHIDTDVGRILQVQLSPTNGILIWRLVLTENLTLSHFFEGWIVLYRYEFMAIIY